MANGMMFPGKEMPVNPPSYLPILNLYDKYPTLVLKKKGNLVTILYFHGNGETIYDAYETYRSMGDLKEHCNFIAPEYSGYGLRADEPGETEDGCLEMAESVLRYAHESCTALIVVGYSIGSGPATHLGRMFPDQIMGIVLVNPFVSIRSLAKDRFGNLASVLLWKDKFGNSNNIRHWKGKLVIVCGKKDTTIEYTHSVRLHEKCPSRYKKIIIHEELGHSFPDWNRYVLAPIMETWFGRKSP